MHLTLMRCWWLGCPQTRTIRLHTICDSRRIDQYAADHANRDTTSQMPHNSSQYEHKRDIDCGGLGGDRLHAFTHGSVNITVTVTHLHELNIYSDYATPFFFCLSLLSELSSSAKMMLVWEQSFGVLVSHHLKSGHEQPPISTNNTEMYI